MHSQHCGYWCPGAKAPGHQYPQCWLNIHCIGPVSYTTIAHKVNSVRKWNHVFKKMTQSFKLQPYLPGTSELNEPQSGIVSLWILLSQTCCPIEISILLHVSFLSAHFIGANFSHVTSGAVVTCAWFCIRTLDPKIWIITKGYFKKN